MDWFLFIIPVVSGLIGLLTNHIAVIMLFRPYRTVRLLRITLLGQGVIPRNRERIAGQIGKIVEEEFLAREVIRSRLEEKQTHEFMTDAFRKYLTELSTQNLGSIRSMLAGLDDETVDRLVTQTAKGIGDRLLEIHEDGSSPLQDMEEMIAGSLNKPLDKILPEVVRDRLRGTLESLLVDVLRNPAPIVSTIAGDIIRWLDTEERTPSSLASVHIHYLVYRQIQSLATVIVSGVADLLREEERQAELSELVMDQIRSLDLSWWKELILELVAPTIAREVPPRIVDFIASEGFERQLDDLLRTYYEKLMQMPLREIVRQFDPDGMRHDLKTHLIPFFSEAMQTPQMQDSLRRSISPFFDNLFSRKPAQILNPGGLGSFSEFLRKVAEHPDGRSFIDSGLKGLIHFIIRQPLGKPERFIDPDLTGHVAVLLSSAMQEALVDHSEEILGHMNIREMVEVRIQSYSLKELERLIREVSSRELRYITWFGGGLGFLIGLIQMVVYWIK